MTGYRFCRSLGGWRLRPDHIRDTAVDPKRSLCGLPLVAVADETEPVTPDTVRRQLGERYSDGTWVLCDDCGDVYARLTDIALSGITPTTEETKTDER